MKPESITEQMMYNTVRLVTDDGSSGTGSYFKFKIGDKEVPVIITNKHVINNNRSEPTTFFLHTTDSNGEPNGNFKIRNTTDWIFHKNKDICYCYISPLFVEIERKYGKKVYVVFNDESIIPSKEKLKELSAIEELVMVGYPIGLWDKRNNFPIFRKGYTACHPGIDFNEDGIGLVDMACFPGSSGSPIYILNEGGYRDKKGNTYIGQSRIMLVGYLYAGPQYSALGDLIIQEIPTTQPKVSTNTPIMTNLGYYVKSTEILDFKQIIQSDMSK